MARRCDRPSPSPSRGKWRRWVGFMGNFVAVCLSVCVGTRLPRGMALLRTQRFCCLQRDPATDLVLNFHPEVFHGLCLFSATLGLAGLLFQMLPRPGQGDTTLRLGSLEEFQPALKIRNLVNVCCCLGNAGLVLRSVLWYSMSEDIFRSTIPAAALPFFRILCVLISSWIHYFYTTLFFAVFFYAVEAFLLLKYSGGVRSASLYWFLSWGISSLVILQGILMVSLPSGSRCDSLHGLILFHEVVTYVPLVLALLGNPLLLARAFSAVTAILRKKTGSYTASERLQKRKIRAQFVKMTVTFTACWLVNLVTEGLLLLLELEPEWNGEILRVIQMAAFTTWTIAAILNPFYGFLHSLDFYGWRGRAVRAFFRRRLVTRFPWRANRWCDYDNGASSETDEDCGFDPLPNERPQRVAAPNIHELLDSGASAGPSCSSLEVNASRLLGTARKTSYSAI